MMLKLTYNDVICNVRALLFLLVMNSTWNVVIFFLYKKVMEKVKVQLLIQKQHSQHQAVSNLKCHI